MENVNLKAESKLNGKNETGDEYLPLSVASRINETLNDTNTMVFTSDGTINTKQQRLEDYVPEINEISYMKNTNKEEICLEYLSNFKKQFQLTFPDRKKQLYMSPLNENNIPKFVCTTIRPTLLPYKDLYDIQKCADFVSNIIVFEPLSNPLEPPACLPSPTLVLKWQIGDAFDISTLLVSLLIGAGYDAFVVYGNAPKWICLSDQSSTICPFLINDMNENKNKSKNDCLQKTNKKLIKENENNMKEIHVGEDKTNSNTTTNNNGFKSSYLEMQEKLENEKKLLNEKSNELYEFDDINIKENEEKDIYYTKRIHAWVLVRAGKRDIENHLFIESSTGRIYNINESPYYKIESLWNHQNYWFNMQINKSIESTLFDLTNPSDWEYVFISNTINDINNIQNDEKIDHLVDDIGNTIKDMDKDNKNNNELSHSDDEINNNNILDIPPTWVLPLIISRDLYRKQYINDGQKITIYKKTKLEQFAINNHKSGLIRRITIFRDQSRILPIEVQEYYKNRKDKLDKRIRYPLENYYEEFYLPGRIPDALKYRSEKSGRTRELHYYINARLDGLMKRKDILHKKYSCYYEGREDRLIYRSVTVREEKEHGAANHINNNKINNNNTVGNNTSMSNGNITNGLNIKVHYTIPPSSPGHGEFVIERMSEKFERNNNIIADEDIYKRTYNIRDGTIYVRYHYPRGKITCSSRFYYKNGNSTIEIIQPDPNIPRPKESILQEDYQIILIKEKDCYSAIRHNEIETQELLKFRKREESSIILELSIFERARDVSKDNIIKEKMNEQEQQSETEESDYLIPFIQTVGPRDPNNLTKEEAQKTKDLCLKSLKDRLLERANIIQTRLDDENAQLAKRQAAFQRSQRDHNQETDDEFEKFCTESMFRIQILEQRLNRHEESACQKYADLDQKLHAEPRLALLNR